MTDIINELRATQYDKDNFPRMKSELACSVGLALRAADEIERLREINAQNFETLNRIRAELEAKDE